MALLNISSTDEALNYLDQSCNMVPLQGYDLFRSVAQEVRFEYARMNDNRDRRFDLVPVLRVAYEFYKDWQWYTNFGIELEDFRDVIESGMKFLKLIMENGYSYLGETPQYVEEKYTVHRSLPGYAEWLSFAGQRFDEISHTDKYKRGWDRDPIGQ